jgi:CheY-like chemotaxis protein
VRKGVKSGTFRGGCGGAALVAGRTVDGVRVLICDDEEDIRVLYRQAFESSGLLDMEVSEAADGNECIAAAVLHDPDLVILDLFMPGRDGLSALPELRRCCPRARVLIVSAHAAVEVFERGRSLGATACFDKLGFLERIPLVIERYGTAAA